MTAFSAYRIFEEGGKSAGRFVELMLDELDPGEVVIRTHYSSVNYKDALAATGASKVMRRFPCVGGVDAAGVVESSSDGRFKVGDEVLVTGYGMGVYHDGGYAEYMRVSADWWCCCDTVRRSRWVREQQHRTSSRKRLASPVTCRRCSSSRG